MSATNIKYSKNIQKGMVMDKAYALLLNDILTNNKNECNNTALTFLNTDGIPYYKIQCPCRDIYFNSFVSEGRLGLHTAAGRCK